MEKGRSLGRVGWYCATSMLWAALLLLCFSGWCRGLCRSCGAARAVTALSCSYLEGENRAWWGCLPSVCLVDGCDRICSSIFDIISSIIFSLCPLHKSYCCVYAWPVPALPPANLSKGLASPSLPPAPLLSNDNLKWWAKCASQNPVDLPMWPSLRAAAPVLAVGPSRSTIMRFSLWQGKTPRENIFFSASGLILFQSQVSPSLKS